MNDSKISRSCFLFLLGEVKQQLEHTMNYDERKWVTSWGYCMKCYYPAKQNSRMEGYPLYSSNSTPTLYNVIHNILRYPFNVAEDEGSDEQLWKKIDESIEYGCLYEMFLSSEQYDDMEKNDYSAKKINKDTDKWFIWWVNEDDENYIKMNKFLENLYKECCDHVKEKFYRERNLPEIQRWEE